VAAGGTPSRWRVMRSGGARKLMPAIVALGALSAVTGCGSGSGSQTATAESQLQAYIKPVHDAINSYSSRVKACKGSLSCVEGLDRGIAAALNTFQGKLRTIPMPSDEAKKGAASLASAVSQTASIFTQLSAATSPTKYISLASSSGVQQSVSQLNNEYLLLGGVLSH
jgi:hypothetical protein